MDYSLGGISFQSVGIIPVKQNGSDLALSGHLDFPERLGKCFHDWKGQKGVQPYVSASEMRFAGRDLLLRCVIRGTSRLACLTTLNNFYSRLDGYTTLQPLIGDYGTFNVYVKDAIIGDYLGDNTLEFFIPFREPNPALPTTLPIGSNVNGIDGIGWSNMGSILIGLRGRYNRSAIKNVDITQYSTEKYYISKTGENNVNLLLQVKGSSYSILAANVGKIQALITRAGVRTLTIENDITRTAFACKGIKVTDIKNDWSAMLSCELIQI